MPLVRVPARADLHAARDDVGQRHRQRAARAPMSRSATCGTPSVRRGRRRKKGKGWLFAAGELAMTARRSGAVGHLGDRSAGAEAGVVRDAAERDVLLKSGVGTGYGLGRYVGTAGRPSAHLARRRGVRLHHERTTSIPDDRTAIVVFTNLDATDASSQIASKTADVVFSLKDPEAGAALTAVACDCDRPAGRPH